MTGINDTAALRTDIEGILNRHSAEEGSNTPDFILAEYLIACLGAYDAASRRREKWYGYALEPARIDGPVVKLEPEAL